MPSYSVYHEIKLVFSSLQLLIYVNAIAYLPPRALLARFTHRLCRWRANILHPKRACLPA